MIGRPGVPNRAYTRGSCADGYLVVDPGWKGGDQLKINRQVLAANYINPTPAAENARLIAASTVRLDRPGDAAGLITSILLLRLCSRLGSPSQ